MPARAPLHPLFLALLCSAATPRRRRTALLARAQQRTHHLSVPLHLLFVRLNSLAIRNLLRTNKVLRVSAKKKKELPYSHVKPHKSSKETRTQAPHRKHRANHEKHLARLDSTNTQLNGRSLLGTRERASTRATEQRRRGRISTHALPR